jgi:hypothetical protein
MKRLIYHIIRLLLAFLPVAFIVAPATGQVEVYQGDTTRLSVEQMPGDTYRWDLYRDSTVNFANTDGDVLIPGEAYFVDAINTGPAVDVVWIQPGIYFFRVMAYDPVMCTNNLKVGRLVVKEALPEVVLEGDSVCIGDPATLTLNLSGEAPWDVTYTNGTDTWTVEGITENVHEIIIPTNAVGTFEYWVTELTDANGTNYSPSEKTKITIYPNPTNSRIYQVDK